MPDWSWVTAHVPHAAECVLRDMLEQRARDTPDKPYVRFEDGSSWTYGETLTAARQAAAGLAALGVTAGDVVFLWLPNGPGFLRAWFGVNFLGAAVAAPNLALRGTVLEHLIALSGARIAIVHGGVMDRLGDIALGSLTTLVEAGPASGLDLGLPVLAADAVLTGHPADAAPRAMIHPWTPQFILFTSGTTGPSKGAIVTYVQMHDLARATFGGRLGADDNYLLNMPLFHISGTRAAYGMLMLGGAITLVGHFKTDSFWDIARQHGTTACVLLGAAASFLEGRPPRPDDADNPMKLVSMVPLVRDPGAWGARFGVDVVTAYGMSELSVPILSDRNPAIADSCGKLRPGYQARIVDDFDCDVPEGGIGELILRADRPWTISPGYWRMPEATAEVWRNGWFHTGDSFRRDPDGNYFFVDRKKDAIRRRGENISSYEVEVEALAHPAVREAAAIGVPSPVSEDDLMIVVALEPGETLDAKLLFDHLRPRMAHFMLPRYIRFVGELPKTPSLRVQKHLLRDAGVTSDTWDRELAGENVRRETIVG
ncbi:AMP-binding protein [Sphingomonas sp. 37zxx]|uniref:AMP-binding protein n=1 Tax=Sphingomonas sp. 37zxx TaxID=1550073 RepID=UPI00069225E4|nr:AMP-binding protein [Sphingomonas sp. 37zxx]